MNITSVGRAYVDHSEFRDSKAAGVQIGKVEPGVGIATLGIGRVYATPGAAFKLLYAGGS